MTLVTGLTPEKAPGFWWDGRHCSEYGVYLLRSRFPVLPGTRDRYLAVAGRHGDWDLGLDYEALEIELEVAVRATSESDLRRLAREIAAWLDPTKGERPLVLDTEPDRYYQARLAGGVVIEPVAAGLGRATLPFRASDPHAYALVDDVFSFTAPGNYRFFRRGTAPSYPRIEIQGTSSGSGNAAITVELGGKAITYTGPLAAGEKLVLDSDTLTAYRETGGGQVSAINDLDSLDFPVAAPGNNELILAVDGAATLKKATITCRSRWL